MGGSSPTSSMVTQRPRGTGARCSSSRIQRCPLRVCSPVGRVEEGVCETPSVWLTLQGEPERFHACFRIRKEPFQDRKASRLRGTGTVCKQSRVSALGAAQNLALEVYGAG